jgi:hypothetical protein
VSEELNIGSLKQVLDVPPLLAGLGMEDSVAAVDDEPWSLPSRTEADRLVDVDESFIVVSTGCVRQRGTGLDGRH